MIKNKELNFLTWFINNQIKYIGGGYEKGKLFSVKTKQFFTKEELVEYYKKETNECNK